METGTIGPLLGVDEFGQPVSMKSGLRDRNNFTDERNFPELVESQWSPVLEIGTMRLIHRQRGGQ